MNPPCMRCILAVLQVWLAAAAAPPAPAAPTADPRQAEHYTAALLAEARLEEALRSLRACLLYTAAAGLVGGEAHADAERAAAVLANARAGLHAEALTPNPTIPDLDAVQAESQAALAALTETLARLRTALEAALGPRPRRALPAPAPPLAGQTGAALTDQLVLGALGPTKGWHGWSEGPEAWAVFHRLGLQFMSPWFGHYWPRPDAQIHDVAQGRAVAGTLEQAGFPMLVWLEPEFDIDSLWAEIGEEMYQHDALGRWQKRTRINNTINVFHPRVREELCRALERATTPNRGDPRVLGYELVEEPALRFDAAAAGSATLDPRYGGYSKAARSSFAARLQTRYGTVEELNRRWGTDYTEFAAVTPPAHLERREGTWPAAELPLLIEFQTHRAVEHAECFRQMVTALHRADPGRPVIPQITTGLFGDPLGGVDLSRLAEAGWDILTFHTDTSFAYVHSLARYQGKPLWNDEFIWTANSGRQPYLTFKATVAERELRAHAAIELWRNLMWGARGLVIFNLDFAWDDPKDGGNWNNELLNGLTGNRQPRYAAAAFATVLPRAQTFFPELRDSAVVHEGVLLLEPTTSVYAAVPTGTVQWWGRRLLAEAQRRFYRPAICPERYLVEGREDLAGVRLLVVPPAPYVPTAVLDRIHAWISGGGTLVTLGDFATHDEYGRPRRAGATPAGAQPGSTAAIGKGRHIAIPARVPVEPVISALWDAVDAAAGARAVTASDPRLELMLRQVTGGGFLLLVLNQDPRTAVAATVHLGVPATRITDLMVDGGAPVPLGNQTQPGTVPVALDPGEARAFRVE